MSWQEVTYWALRCDGDTTHGQCPNQLYPEPDSLVVPVAWDSRNKARYQPALFTSCDQCELNEQWIAEHGWLKTDARLLCPEHVTALELLAEAEMTGLPFEV